MDEQPAVIKTKDKNTKNITFLNSIFPPPLASPEELRN